MANKQSHKIHFWYAYNAFYNKLSKCNDITRLQKQCCPLIKVKVMVVLATCTLFVFSCLLTPLLLLHRMLFSFHFHVMGFDLGAPPFVYDLISICQGAVYIVYALYCKCLCQFTFANPECIFQSIFTQHGQAFF